MIKSLQHVRGWTFGPDTVGVTTVVVNDAWQFPKTDTDSSAPHAIAMKPRAKSSLNILLRRPRSMSAISVRPRMPKVRSGKIMRCVLGAMSNNEDAGDISTLPNPEIVDEIRKMKS